MDFDKMIDQAAETRGRPNKNLTQQHYEEKKATYRLFNNTKQPDNFNSDIIERVAGEIVPDEDINQFKELYKLTCYDCLDRFKQEEPDLSNKNVFLWYKRVLIDIKKSVPKITADDIDKCEAVWEVLREFLDYIGLYITWETFQNLTSIYLYQIKDRCKLSPKYSDFLQKMNNDRDAALLNELQYNGYNQTNKIFIAKTHGIIEKTETKQIEVNHNIRNFDNISDYRISEKDKNS